MNVNTRSTVPVARSMGVIGLGFHHWQTHWQRGSHTITTIGMEGNMKTSGSASTAEQPSWSKAGGGVGSIAGGSSGGDIDADIDGDVYTEEDNDDELMDCSLL
jgi:hypothetical protein